MRIGVLFSGGKDSTLAAFLAKQDGHELVCCISMISENPDSYMFHTPSIAKTEKQAEVMGLPLLTCATKGEKEKELVDLVAALKNAKEKYNIEAITTGAVQSVYQASRIQKICDDLGIKCINPLWQMDSIELLELLLKHNFEVIVIGIAAYPLDDSWLGRTINKQFIEDMKKMEKQYGISPAGEGGEFESFVLNCPLFKKPLNVIDKKISGEGNAWRMEIDVSAC